MNSEVTIANSESTTNDAEIAKQSANVDAVGTGGSDTTTRASGAASAGTNCNNEEDSAPQTFTMADAEDSIHASDGNPDKNKKENGSSARARKENNKKKSLNTSTPRKRKRSTATTTTTTGTAESSDPGSAVTKTRKYTRRKAPPPDIFLSPELQERLQSAQKEIDEAKKAALAVEEAERQLALAQKRVEDAEKQKNVTQERAEEVATQFSLHFPQAKGPWKEQYDMLVAYHAEHNSCIVRGHTPEMKALRNWTLRQRERYFLRDDNPNKLPWYLARQLDNLGFLWNYSEDSFQKHYNDLITFKEEFGHCAVPRSYKENPSLAHWVKRVRFDAHKFRSDPSAVTLTESQYQKLESIGFVWENLSRSWNERFEDLLKFKAEHGHCRVPRDYESNKKLVQWCQNQRAHHRAFMQGKKSSMSEARKKQLEEVGFEWEIGGSRSSRKRPAQRKKAPAEAKQEEEESEQDSEDDEVGEQDDDEADTLAVARPVAEAVDLPPTMYGRGQATPGYQAAPSYVGQTTAYQRLYHHAHQQHPQYY